MDTKDIPATVLRKLQAFIDQEVAEKSAVLEAIIDKINEENAFLKAQVEKLEEENSSLKVENASLKSDISAAAKSELAAATNDGILAEKKQLKSKVAAAAKVEKPKPEVSSSKVAAAAKVEEMNASLSFAAVIATNTGTISPSDQTGWQSASKKRPTPTPTPGLYKGVENNKLVLLPPKINVPKTTRNIGAALTVLNSKNTYIKDVTIGLKSLCHVLKNNDISLPHGTKFCTTSFEACNHTDDYHFTDDFVHFTEVQMQQLVAALQEVHE